MWHIILMRHPEASNRKIRLRSGWKLVAAEDMTSPHFHKPPSSNDTVQLVLDIFAGNKNAPEIPEINLRLPSLEEEVIGTVNDTRLQRLWGSVAQARSEQGLQHPYGQMSPVQIMVEEIFWRGTRDLLRVPTGSTLAMRHNWQIVSVSAPPTRRMLPPITIIVDLPSLEDPSGQE